MFHQVISTTVRECCVALISVLKDMINWLENEQEWLQKESDFGDTFPHYLAAIVGKHFVMVSPIHSGSEYFNYKHSFSIVLMTLVDRNFCFMFCDVGNMGRIGDGGVFRDGFLFKHFRQILYIYHNLNHFLMAMERCPTFLLLTMHFYCMPT